MAQCKGKKLYTAPCGPHVYGTSEKAYAAMKKSSSNQCIVVSGESGAGKTEANRQLMNYLIWHGSDAETSQDLDQHANLSPTHSPNLSPVPYLEITYVAVPEQHARAIDCSPLTGVTHDARTSHCLPVLLTHQDLTS